jgi:IclR family transcriptional regulator, acetate operon repressor
MSMETNAPLGWRLFRIAEPWRPVAWPHAIGGIAVMASVQSVSRAFRVLDALATGDMGITEIADHSSLPKSTVARLVRTLEEVQAVERAGSEGRYRIGSQIVTLARAASPNAGLLALTRPHLRSLARATGEDAGFSIPAGYRVHYIDQVSSHNAIQVRDWTGEEVAMHATPSGQVLLATWPEKRVERYLATPLEAFTAHTITDPASLRRRLAQVRDDGYAAAFEEFLEGLNAVAAPVFDSKGRPVGSLHVHGPAYRFPAPDALDDLGRLLIETASRLGRLIPDL